MEAQRYLQRTINRIMVVLTGDSEETFGALRYAAGLSRLCDASVLLVYPLELRPLLPFGTAALGVPGVIPARAWDGIQQGAEAILEAARRIMTGLGIQTDTKLINVWSGVGWSIRKAARGECDLIVVPHVRIGGIRRVLRKSDAVEMVKHAPCPVVVVGSPEEKTPARESIGPGT